MGSANFMAHGSELIIRGISVSRKGKLILDDVSFFVKPKTLTAIIGPNGAGKTTLMRALSGEKPDSGQVMINGNDLYKNPEYWLQKIGYVPVDNILHEHLTLQEALIFIGKLRLPDMDQAAIENRVDLLLNQFGFPADDDRRNKQIKLLSSGELKRANICSELIVNPSILMLDEPTSNLDPNAEYQLISLLAVYAHRNHKTVLVITHTLNTLDLFDEVLFIENSKLRAQGNPEKVLTVLENEYALQNNAGTPASMFARWAQVFEKTKTMPRVPHTIHRSEGTDGQENVSSNSPLSINVSWLSQFWVLIARYLKVRMGDQWGLWGTLLAGMSGVLFFTLPGNVFVKPFDLGERALALNQARQAVYVVSLVVTLLGMITSYTEISKEFRIYSHERLKGLVPFAYFLSKWAWLTLAVGFLAPIILMIFIVFVYQQPLPGFLELRIGETMNWWEKLTQVQLVGFFTSPTSGLILVTLILTCITSVTLGLLISCVAADGGKGYLYLSFSVVFIVLFSGLIRNLKLEELINTLSFLSTGKWAYEGISSSISIYCWMDSWRFDEFNSTGHIISIWLSLALFTLISIALSVIILHLRDPWYGRMKNFGLFVSKNRTRIAVYLSVIILLFSYTIFFRSLSYEYHSFNYWSRSEYGGTNEYQYANVEKVKDLDPLRYQSGKASQSWCGVE
jgi:ABC-type multidrug transport system ATPase subunit